MKSYWEMTIILCCVLQQAVCWIISRGSCRDKYIAKASRISLSLKKRDWTKRKGEINIDLGFDEDEEFALEDIHRIDSAESVSAMKSKNVEDRVKFITEDSAQSISGMTLRQISRGYGFSMNYLGDFVSTQGIHTLVEVDKKIGDMMTGQDIYELLVALQSQDPVEVNDGYTGGTVAQFARNHDLSYEELAEICKDNDVLLPFGPITVLHNSVYTFLLPYVEAGLPNENSLENDSPTVAENSILQRD